MIEQDKDNCKINSVRYCNLFNLSLPWVESNKCDVTKKEKKKQYDYSKTNTLINLTISYLNLNLKLTQGIPNIYPSHYK